MKRLRNEQKQKSNLEAKERKKQVDNKKATQSKIKQDKVKNEKERLDNLEIERLEKIKKEREMKDLKAKDNVKTLDRKKSNSFNGSNLALNPMEHRRTKSAQIPIKPPYFIIASDGNSETNHINCEKHNNNVSKISKNYKHTPSATINNQ